MTQNNKKPTTLSTAAYIPGHSYLMTEALREAMLAFDEGEVPVGAVVELGGEVIGRGHNRIEALKDATAHAEMIAIAEASKHIGDWRLNECTLYVTLEPCLMCLGAILQSRIGAVVYGAADNRLGAIESFNYKGEAERSYGAFPEVIGGVMEEEARGALQAFFKKLRGE